MLLIVACLLSYLPQYRNKSWAVFIEKMANYTCSPVRKILGRYLSSEMPFDLSPLIVIAVLKILVALF